jgi:EmrB/QacA subfamily drug resistance transporter
MTEEKKLKNYEWTVLSVTTIGVLMASIQSSALLIALPDVMINLHMDFLTIMWVLLSYMLITTAMLPILGHLSDMFGRKKLYVLGFGVFALGSFLCCLAQPQYHGADLIVYRIVQALGGALLMANATAMVTDAFHHSRLGRGLGINMVAGGAGIVVGPIVGGILTQFGWQWIFLINVPFALIGMAWGWIRLREPQLGSRDTTLDWMGSSAFIIGLSAILLGVSLYAFPLVGMELVYSLLVVGVLGITAFIFLSLRSSHPMIDLRLFHNRDFAVGNITALVNGLGRGATLFLLIFFFQGPYGQDPLTAGLSLIPFGLAFIIAGPLAGQWSDRMGPRLLSILGLVITAISLLGFVFIDHSTPFWMLTILMLLSGVGGGLFSTPNSSAIMKSVSPQRRGMAGATRSMLVNVGSMFSLAIALPMVLSNISQEDMMRLFLYGGGISPQALTVFENGLHLSFLLFFGTAVVAIVVAMYHTKVGSPVAAPQGPSEA